MPRERLWLRALGALTAIDRGELATARTLLCSAGAVVGEDILNI